MRYSFDSIAFCGGGGRGAYQIGVWKAMTEYGCLDHVRAVSGTSIGALNAVLFALGDYELAKEKWLSLGIQDVFSPNTGDSDGLFSRKGTERLLRELDLNRLKSSPFQVFVNVCNTKRLQTESIRLNDLSGEEMIAVLLASSSIPVIFGTETLDGVKYIDGVWFEEGNAPVAPLYRAGCRRIAVLPLEHDYSLGAKANPLRSPNFQVLYPDAELTLFTPFEYLGGPLSGTCNFSQWAIRRKMIAGYRDAKKILSDEDIYIVKNNYMKINAHIAKKMRTLFQSAAEIETFIQNAVFPNPNLDMQTVGGAVFYTDIVSLFGWKVQQHNVVGLKSHYRILDPQNVRRAWMLDPDDLIRELETYECAGKFV